MKLATSPGYKDPDGRFRVSSAGVKAYSLYPLLQGGLSLTGCGDESLGSLIKGMSVTFNGHQYLRIEKSHC